MKILVAGFLVACRLAAADALDTQQKPEQAIFALMSPPAAQTADSIAVLWDKPAGVSVEGYDIYLGSNIVATTEHTDYTLQGLAAAQNYEISVRAHVADGKFLQSNPVRIATRPQPQVFDITTHGAVGDGKTLSTHAIQAAIDACNPGGVVRVPAGVFLC